MMATSLPLYVSPPSSAYNYQPTKNRCQNLINLLTCRRRTIFGSGFFRRRLIKLLAFVILATTLLIVYVSGFAMLPDDSIARTKLKNKFFPPKARPPAAGDDDDVLPNLGSFKNSSFFNPGRNKPDKPGDSLVGQIPKPKSGEDFANSRMQPKFDPNDPIFKAERVKNMTIKAWDSYKKYAWGSNELRPISKTGHSASVFGPSDLGATIVDALDTLYIMNLSDRFMEGRKWVEMSFDFSRVSGDVSVFETTIRFIGGFLACFALTGDELFKRKADEVAEKLLPAFNTPTGIPYGLINVKSGKSKNYHWASGGSSILSEFGTLSLEFDYLSVVTRNPVYSNKMRKIRQTLNSLEKPDGLYPNYLSPQTGKWGMKHVSLGGLGDSFYEYLLKSWLITNKADKEGLRMYEEAMEAIQRQMFSWSTNNLFYIGELRGGRLDPKMDHLACFSGGMFALHAVNSANSTARKYWLTMAEELAKTCHESYRQTATKLGPESFWFTEKFSAMTEDKREQHYILRPEVIETWFYLWRLTKKQKYRDWAWDAVKAIEKYCSVADSGYSGIRNVYATDSAQDDVQQSYFLAETLKYLYLIFLPDNVMSLRDWVFNSEGHALPIRFDDADHAPYAAIGRRPIADDVIDNKADDVIDNKADDVIDNKADDVIDNKVGDVVDADGGRIGDVGQNDVIGDNRRVNGAANSKSRNVDVAGDDNRIAF